MNQICEGKEAERLRSLLCSEDEERDRDRADPLRRVLSRGGRKTALELLKLADEIRMIRLRLSQAETTFSSLKAEAEAIAEALDIDINRGSESSISDG